MPPPVTFLVLSVTIEHLLAPGASELCGFLTIPTNASHDSAMKVLGLQELSIVLPVRFYLKDVTGWWQGSVLNVAFFVSVPNHRPKNKLLVKLHSGEFC